MSKIKALPYRCEPHYLYASGSQVIFGGLHNEKLPQPIYLLDIDKAELKATAGKFAGCSAFAANNTHLFVALEDDQILRISLPFAEPEVLASLPDVTDLICLREGRLGAISSKGLSIFNDKGNEVQHFELPHTPSVLASDQSGSWLAVGCDNGWVAVFQCEDGGEFQAGESAQVHQGAVTAMLFEPDALRVYTAGADGRLMHTQVRGALEPEQRNNDQSKHKHPIVSILAHAGKFFSASKDGIKSWECGLTRKRPVSFATGAFALAKVSFRERDHLLLAGTDRSLRLASFDAKGNPKEVVWQFNDVYAHVDQLNQDDRKQREAALKLLLDLNDRRSMVRLDARAQKERDPELQLLACEYLQKATHPLAKERLENLLRASSGRLRCKAFEGLWAKGGRLKPLKLAFAVKKADLGVLAVTHLETLLGDDERAFQLLLATLDADPIEVRTAAFEALSRFLSKRGCEAEMYALSSRQADIRRLALIRCYQKDLLDHKDVRSALRRHGDDPGPEVRHTAFLISLLTNGNLVDHLRYLDKDLHRQLHELEHLGKDKIPKLKKASKPKTQLAEDDLRPLLESMANQRPDTCLNGTMGLAMLGDERAFGSLLQLSRAPSVETRIQVCHGFRALNRTSALQRLATLLLDQRESVRDAAFTALASIREKTPLAAVETGLSAGDALIRGRALQLLVEVFKGKLKKADQELAHNLLLRVLNDDDRTVRENGFKAVLSQSIVGDLQACLRFCFQSSQADLRRSVLQELFTLHKRDWAWQLLIEQLEDPSEALRKEVFEFALGHKEKDSVDLLGTGITCSHADIRLASVKWLGKNAKNSGTTILVKVLEDEDQAVRTEAIRCLIHSGDSAPLLEALQSSREDVVLEAAIALAARGEKAAQKALVSFVEAPQPDQRPDLWKQRMIQALEGLGLLWADEVRDLVATRLNHKDVLIAEAAASALINMTDGKDVSQLYQAMRADADRVCDLGKYGLAIHGDPVAASSIFSGRPGKWALPTALGLERQHPQYLLALLDDRDLKLSKRATKLSLMLLLYRGDVSGDRLLTMLSSAVPGVRMMAALALETVNNQQEFRQLVHQSLQEGRKDWTVEAETLDMLGKVFAFGENRLRLWAVTKIFPHLEEDKATQFNQQWQLFATRFIRELETIQQLEPEQMGIQFSDEEVRRLVFGSYVGLARLSGRDAYSTRITALTRLCHMAKADESLVSSVRSVHFPALRDQAEEVRRRAFENLVDLGHDPSDLAAETLSTGFPDVGVLGLRLLAESKDSDSVRETLKWVHTTFTNGLEHEAATLRAEYTDPVTVAVEGLEGRSAPLRIQAVAKLNSLYAEEPTAAEGLRSALNSMYDQVRVNAAAALALRKDESCFEPLVKLMASSDNRLQRQAIHALCAFGDPRTPDVFLDRAENDPTGSAQLDALFNGVADFRDLQIADRLLGLFQNVKLRSHAANALEVTSGYDQPINWHDEDETWIEEQHPRHDHLLALLIKHGASFLNRWKINSLIDSARWSKDHGVNEVLVELLKQGKQAKEVLTTLVWRVEHREASPQPLAEALGLKDPELRFIAAEGLARIGRGEGFTILTTAIELFPELHYRQQAVTALGVLADSRALSTLLQLAETAGHALQKEAVEAIGHMAQGKQADKVFELLCQMADVKQVEDLRVSALQGLRWFNTPEAWRVIMSYSKDRSVDVCWNVAAVLKECKDPSAVDVLMDMLRHQPETWVSICALESLREHLGKDSLEPDYAVLASKDSYLLDEKICERLAERGDPQRLLEGFHHQSEAILNKLITGLQNREEAPIEAAANFASSQVWAQSEAAARILGRAGEAAKAHGPVLTEAVASNWQAWLAADKDNLRQDISNCLSHQIWACARTGQDLSVVKPIIENKDRSLNILQLHIVECLGLHPSKVNLQLLAWIAQKNDRMGDLATQVLAGLESTEDLSVVSLQDPARSGFLLAGGAQFAVTELKEAAKNAEGQINALGVLVAEGQWQALEELASDSELAEELRLGAIESLAVTAGQPAQDALRRLATAEQQSKELTKAAWRALRRSKRYQSKLAESQS